MQNDNPVLSTGLAEDGDSQREARQLVANDTFKKIISAGFGGTLDTFLVKETKGIDLKWKDTEECIARSVAGKVELGGEDGALHWIVFGENSRAIATALCISPEIERIALKS